MSHYTQLTAFDRGRIEELLDEHMSMRQIASKLHRSVSTISREIHRYGTNSYRAETAHADYMTSRKNSHRTRKLSDRKLRSEVIQDIQVKHWSPEQIAGRLSVTAGHNVISYNTIYRGIARDNLMIKKNYATMAKLGGVLDTLSIEVNCLSHTLSMNVQSMQINVCE